MDLGVDTSQIGRYIRLDTEKEAIKLLEKAGRKVVLHFSHAEFKRCKLMDQHLEVSQPMSGGPMKCLVAGRCLALLTLLEPLVDNYLRLWQLFTRQRCSWQSRHYKHLSWSRR